MKHSNIKKYYREINKLLYDLQNRKVLKPFNRNYCYFFTSEDNENLSICAEFNKQCIENYYGISPKLNIKNIIQNINDGVFNDKNAFNKIVDDYVNIYWKEECIDKFSIKERKALMARSLVNIYSCFVFEGNKCKLNDNRDALYNGVNNRLVKVNSDYFEVSGKTNYIKFELQRTTYFTSLAFKVIDNPLLEDYKEDLKKIDDYESACFNNLNNSLKDCPDQKKSIYFLNEYLQKSKHTHYINVSANITSMENDLIYCLRGASEDQSTLYCSANGVSEVYDENVDYYMFSVNEDVPTINVNRSFNRIDFANEINREIRAELNIENMTNIYDFYGFTIMAKLDNNQLIDACHFNILASTHCYENFDEICRHHEKAIEKSEAETVYGWKIKRFNSIFHAIFDYIILIGKFILEYDKLFFAICVLLTYKEHLFSFEFSNVFDRVITIISLIVLISSFFKLAFNSLKKVRAIHTTVIIGKRKNAFDDYIKKYHKKIARKKFNNKAHYIYEIMALCYYLDNVE